MTNALLPLLRGRASASPQGARVVNVCSSAGKRRILRSDALAARFDAAASADDVMALMAEFVADIRAGKHLEKGWPNRCGRLLRRLSFFSAPRNAVDDAC